MDLTKGPIKKARKHTRELMEATRWACSSVLSVRNPLSNSYKESFIRGSPEPSAEAQLERNDVSSPRNNDELSPKPLRKTGRRSRLISPRISGEKTRMLRMSIADICRLPSKSQLALSNDKYEEKLATWVERTRSSVCMSQEDLEDMKQQICVHPYPSYPSRVS